MKQFWQGVEVKRVVCRRMHPELGWFGYASWKEGATHKSFNVRDDGPTGCNAQLDAGLENYFRPQDKP